MEAELTKRIAFAMTAARQFADAQGQDVRDAIADHSTYRRGREDERKEVVSWLRSLLNNRLRVDDKAGAFIARFCAGVIECGDHTSDSDTHPEGGDSEAAPFMGSAGLQGIAQTFPSPHSGEFTR